jgi:hypothetical protein
MKTRPLAVALLLAFAPATTATPVVFAQGGAQGAAQDDALTKAARARFQEGVEFFDKGQFENARAAFLQAYALKKHPAVLLNLAQSSLRSGHTLESAKFFQQYLREATTATPAQRADAERGLADARKKLGQLEVSAPAGAEISVDGERVGTAPLVEPVDVEPGSRVVRMQAPDGTTDSQNVSATAGTKLPVRLGQQQAAAVPPPVPVAPVPPATEPTAPAAEPTEPPVATETTGATPTEPPAVQVDSRKSNLFAPPANRIPSFIGAGVAVLGFGTAITFAIFKGVAQSNADDVENQIRQRGGGAGSCDPAQPVARFANACRQLQDNRDTVDTNATIANIGLGVGIAGAAFAAGWWLFSPKASPAAPAYGARTNVSPWIGHGVGGMSVQGSF